MMHRLYINHHCWACIHYTVVILSHVFIYVGFITSYHIVIFVVWLLTCTWQNLSNLLKETEPDLWSLAMYLCQARQLLLVFIFDWWPGTSNSKSWLWYLYLGWEVEYCEGDTSITCIVIFILQLVPLKFMHNTGTWYHSYNITLSRTDSIHTLWT